MRLWYDTKKDNLILQFTKDQSKLIGKNNFLEIDKKNVRDLSAAFVQIGVELGKRVIEIENKLKKQNDKSPENTKGSHSKDKK